MPSPEVLVLFHFQRARLFETFELETLLNT